MFIRIRRFVIDYYLCTLPRPPCHCSPPSIIQLVDYSHNSLYDFNLLITVLHKGSCTTRAQQGHNRGITGVQHHPFIWHCKDNLEPPYQSLRNVQVVRFQSCFPRYRLSFFEYSMPFFGHAFNSLLVYLRRFTIIVHMFAY